MSASDAGTEVRILVIESHRQPAFGSARTLQHLGPEVAVDALFDADEALERVAEGSFDLAVIDHRHVDAARATRGLREAGTPVIAVHTEQGERWAMDAFRLGAAECLTAGPDFAESLPALALEQIRRHRAERERGRAERLSRKVDDLQRYTSHILESMSGGLVVLDLDGRIVFANPSAAQVIGVTREELLGTPLEAWLRDAEASSPPIAATLHEGRGFRGAETFLLRRDGQAVPVGLSCAPLEDRDGVRAGAAAIFQDLTAIKQLERQVHQSEKMASIGQLAAGVAHEINNPMGFIQANLFQMNEYLEDLRRVFDAARALSEGAEAADGIALLVEARKLRELATDVDASFLLEDLGKAVRESLEGAERIRHIVKDLRSFSHQDEGNWVEADLNECLDSTANIVWTMTQHTVEMKKDYAELPSVRCLPMQLKQVFMNLLVNAVQAVEGAGRTTGTLRLRTRHEGERVRVEVEDDGPGIPEEDQHRIFEPFFTTKEVGLGVGLGLSTSYNIVLRHGGEMRVVSAPGQGTRFEIELPRGGPRAEA